MIVKVGIQFSLRYLKPSTLLVVSVGWVSFSWKSEAVFLDGLWGEKSIPRNE
jgi:hypothetical protein